MRTPIFKKERTVYWPSEFDDVVNIFRGISDSGERSPNPMYSTNAEVIVLAATIGLTNNRRRVFKGGKNEITTQTFHSRGLDGYLLLIPMLGNPGKGQEILKSENDDFLIAEFEQYASGGLEVLSGIFSDSPGKSPEIIIQTEMSKYLKLLDGDFKKEPPPDIFS